MHILFVTGEYPPMQGGVGAYTSALATALVNSGTQVSIQTSSTSSLPLAPSNRLLAPPDPPLSLLTNELNSDDIDIPIYRDIRKWSPKLYNHVRERATEIKADWIHIQYQTAAYAMNPAINFAPARWKKSGFLNTAWTYHDLLVPYLFPKAGGRIRQWVTERPACDAQLTIVTNEADNLQLLASNNRPEKVVIGSNIHGYALTAEERAERRAKRGYSERDSVIAYFGFLNRSKGGLTLIHTLHRLKQERPQVKLLMIGGKVGASDPTNFAYLQEVEQLIDTLGLRESIQWTGHQPDAEVGADLNACDVLFMPYEDGASLRRGTLMAGLANGCAIVTTQPINPIPELEDGAQLLYVPPRDPKASALIIKHLLDNVALAGQLRRRARRRSKHFHWDAIAERHQELYTQYDARNQNTAAYLG